MKPFLGIDLTTDKENKLCNGNEFLVAQPSSALLQSLMSSKTSAAKIIKQSKLPLPIRIIRDTCGAAAALFSVSILKAISKTDVSFTQVHHNAPWIFGATGICIMIWLFLLILGKQKSKTILGTEETSQNFSKLDNVCNAIYAELAVPTEAEKVDILSLTYEIKKGKLRIVSRGPLLFGSLNPEFRLFSDSNYLYLANPEGKYAFPLSSITAIHTIKNTIHIANWNKTENFNKGPYKQYKLTSDLGCIRCDEYHIVEVNQNGEIWGIYIPCYELPIFEKFTRLKAEIKK